MPNWTELLETQKNSDYFQSVVSFVHNRRQQGITIYPPQSQVFEAFRLTAFDDIRVVILGQDPYHGAGQAHGLCFSVAKGIVIPPSLKNIYQELESDLAIKPANHGCLQSWAEQGVFLLNTVLTVEAGNANSHRGRGWETFTDQVIKIISDNARYVVFLLWGSPAQKKSALIDTDRHTILKTVHPSPLSAYRGFIGCKHFSRANTALENHNQAPVDWSVAD